MGELTEVEDGHDIARKIVSCVARFRLAGSRGGASYGAAHLVNVLRGSREKLVLERGHHQLSTHGILRDVSAPRLGAFVNQLVDAKVLARSPGEYPTVELGSLASAVLKNEITAKLVEPKENLEAEGEGARSKGDANQSRPLDTKERALFDRLRVWRREVADARGVPPFVIASDVVLEELCRVRPTRVEGLQGVRGIGAQKAEVLGAPVVQLIAEYCRESGLQGDQTPSRKPVPEGPPELSGPSRAVMPLFRSGKTVKQVMEETGRARSTVVGYLCDYIFAERPAAIDVWVNSQTQERIRSAIQQTTETGLRPIRDRLVAQGYEEIEFDAIRVVVTHLKYEGRGSSAV
jgi:ATP-dependent DNA helicase RecQ